MIAVRFDRVVFSYASEVLLKDLSWEIHDDRCVGLIGPNGCGKSTLLRLVFGELLHDSGFIVRKKEITIGYLSQDPQLGEGSTVWQEAFSAFEDLLKVDNQLDQVERLLATPQVYGDDRKLARMLERQELLLKEYERLGGANYEGRVRSVLKSLGFKEELFQQPVEQLSGGQKKLLGLAKLLVTHPDLLLLDEPDNHLDMEGKAFLGQFIRSYEGAVVIVSHDRYLLDLVADEIAELEGGKITSYTGSYSEYIFEKRSCLLRQQQLFSAQKKEIERLEQAAQRLITWGKVYDNNKFSRRGQNILKRLERIERLEKPVLEPRRMQFELKGWTGSFKVMEITNLDKVFQGGIENPGSEGDQIVLAGLNLLVTRGERVGLVWANGSGKSVLFRTILGEELPSGGDIVLGPSVRIGYYAQQSETLDLQQTLLDTVRMAGNFSEEGAVAFLNKFLFQYRQVHNPVRTLSGGERSRLQMALLMLSGANFLLLDEPTNHLDIQSAEVLEDALQDFEGTLLVISHDRYFLDRVVKRVVELNNGSLTEYAGGYSDYYAQKNHL